MLNLPKSMLPIIFLLLHITDGAVHSEIPLSDLNIVLSRFEDNIRLDTHLLKTTSANDDDEEDEIKSFFLLSVNHPTRLSFRHSQAPHVKVDAVIERLTSNASRKSVCTFPAFGYEPATHHIKLMSMDNDIEILQIIKIFQDPRNNSMDIFVVNATDCKNTRTEILKGYDYFASGGTFTVLHTGNNKNFDIFSLNGKDECGTYACKWVYDIASRTISKPKKNYLLNYRQDAVLTFMGSSADGGYFSIIRKDDNISLLSLTHNGGLIASIENNTESRVHFLKISTDHGFFGFCYTIEAEHKAVHCMQLDARLRVNANVSLGMGFETSYIAVHNLPQGGFLLLAVHCTGQTGDDRRGSCEEHEIEVRKFDADGYHGFREFSKFTDVGCEPRRQQQFTFFEVDEKICLFYACDWRRREGKGYDKIVRSRCF